MRLNRKVPEIKTHEGGKAQHINAEMQLRRSIMSCLLWEDSFYESGEDIVERITDLIPQVIPEVVMGIAVEAREEMNLRHVPLLIAREMARLPAHKEFVAGTLYRIIQRPDELTEFLSLYWKEKKQPLSAQVKKGLARAFTKFNEYQLAKYNRDNTIKLRDILFLVHAKPISLEQAAVWKKLVDGTLAIPDTWEVELSASQDKKESWTRLLTENKLGALALLRNLRNMQQANVGADLVRTALSHMKTDRILPFRFIAAARYASDFESELEKAMFKNLEELPKLPGKTCLLVDVSGSMDDSISSKSDLKRIDAACGLGMLLREVSEDVSVFTFSQCLKKIPSRRGFALRDAIVSSQPHGSTELQGALRGLIQQFQGVFNRMIVITDEQSSGGIPLTIWPKAYMINVASYRNGVGYGLWTHIDGWSESIVRYIQELEK